MRLRSDCPPSVTRAVAAPTAVFATTPNAASTTSPVAAARRVRRLQPGHRPAALASPIALEDHERREELGGVAVGDVAVEHHPASDGDGAEHRDA